MHSTSGTNLLLQNTLIKDLVLCIHGQWPCWNTCQKGKVAKLTWTISTSPRSSYVPHSCYQGFASLEFAAWGGRGIPDIVKQVEITTQVELAAARGTLKVAQLIGDEEMPNLIVTSLYDQKPFYMMSTGMPKISWITVTKKIWSTVAGKYKEVPFYRLNIVHEYNMKMGRVDLGDQLRGSYRYDHWLRNRKWWWSIFFWTKVTKKF